MEIVKCECEHCKKRSIWCRPTCQSYIAYNANQERIREERLKKSELNYNLYNQHRDRYKKIYK